MDGVTVTSGVSYCSSRFCPLFYY